MTIGAHVVPGLIAPSPVQPVARRGLLVLVKMKPALSALVLWTAVPGRAKCLKSSAGHGDQVLLQWKNTKGIGNFIIVESTVRAIGAYLKLASGEGKGGRHPKMFKRRSVEITENRCLRCLPHRLRVM